MAKAVKMQDIAQKLGVSTMTISKALSGKPGVSEGMREKIKILAEEMGYIASYWGSSGAGARRRYYTITPEGRENCHKLLQEWKETKEIMDISNQIIIYDYFGNDVK